MKSAADRAFARNGPASWTALSTDSIRFASYHLCQVSETNSSIACRLKSNTRQAAAAILGLWWRTCDPVHGRDLSAASEIGSAGSPPTTCPLAKVSMRLAQPSQTLLMYFLGYNLNRVSAHVICPISGRLYRMHRLIRANAVPRPPRARPGGPRTRLPRLGGLRQQEACPGSGVRPRAHRRLRAVLSTAGLAASARLRHLQPTTCHWRGDSLSRRSSVADPGRLRSGAVRPVHDMLLIGGRCCRELRSWPRTRLP